MAKYNEILVGRYNQFLQKAFGIKGPAPSPQLGGDVQPQINLFSGNENRYIEGWKIYTGFVDNPAVPGITTASRIRNRAGSGVLAVITKVNFWTTAVDQVVMRYRANLADGDLGTVGFGAAYERRVNPGGVPNSSVSVSLDIAGSQVGTALHIFNSPPAAVSVGYDIIQDAVQEIPLDPGMWFQFHNIVANNRFVTNFVWRERPIEEGELI